MESHGVKLVWRNKGERQKQVVGEDCSLGDYRVVFPHQVIHTEGLFDRLYHVRKPRDQEFINRIIKGDNLLVLHSLVNSNYEGNFDLIYIDPPFLSSSSYLSRVTISADNKKQVITRPAFDDTWKNDLDSYLEALYTRLILMKRLLSTTGSIFVHLDWHVSHYVKVVLDEVFGNRNFINEIVWCYGGGSGTRKHFHRKHDLIMWYSKSNKYIFNPQYRPYTKGTIERGLTKIKGNKYRLDKRGALMQDWWTDINKILSPTAKENLKFPTQKPAALLKRIIAAASNPGSLVGDFYCGSGTTAEVCEQMDRNWIVADTSDIALQTTVSRLIRAKARPFRFDAIKDAEEKHAGKLSLYHNASRIIKSKDSVSLDIAPNGGELTEVLLLIRITDYVPGSDNIALLPQDYDFTAVIDYWEVDLDYDGRVFYSDFQVMRKTQQFDQSLNLEVICEMPYHQELSLAVKVYDVFGDSAMETIVVGCD